MGVSYSLPDRCKEKGSRESLFTDASSSLPLSLLELFGDENIRFAADVERGALVEFFGLDVENSAVAVRGAASGLLADEGHRVGFVHQAQLAVFVLLGGRVDEDAAGQQVAVKVRHERADVARAVRAARGFVFLLQIVEEALGAVVELLPGAFVGRVVFAALRRHDVLVREQELADGGVVGEAVHAVAGRVDHHHRRAVNDVSGSHLLGAILEAVFEARFGRVVALEAIDREDGADADVDVDVRGAVERVEEQHVVAGVVFGRHDDAVVLLGAHQGEATVLANGADDLFVGEQVELLDLLALHVGRSGQAEDVHQPRPHDFAPDEFGREGDIVQQIGHFVVDFGIEFLLLEKMAFDGGEFVHQ